MGSSSLQDKNGDKNIGFSDKSIASNYKRLERFFASLKYLMRENRIDFRLRLHENYLVADVRSSSV